MKYMFATGFCTGTNLSSTLQILHLNVATFIRLTYYHHQMYIHKGKSRVKLLPVFGWSPKLMNEYKKDFMNHPPKNGQNILYDFPGHRMVFSKYNQ